MSDQPMIDRPATASMEDPPAQCGRTFPHSLHATLAGTCPGLDRDQIAAALRDREDAAAEVEETDERLLWLLRAAAAEWGARGVARAAAALSYRDAVDTETREQRPGGSDDYVRPRDDTPAPDAGQPLVIRVPESGLLTTEVLNPEVLGGRGVLFIPAGMDWLPIAGAFAEVTSERDEDPTEDHCATCQCANTVCTDDLACGRPWRHRGAHGPRREDDA